MSWAGPEDVFFSASLASYLDKKLLVLLRDGRKLLGIFHSFDQFANAVLGSACERVIVGDLYCDIPLGLYVIRGENVVLIGELDLEREELPDHMTRVSVAEIRRVVAPLFFIYSVGITCCILSRFMLTLLISKEKLNALSSVTSLIASYISLIVGVLGVCCVLVWAEKWAEAKACT